MRFQREIQVTLRMYLCLQELPFLTFLTEFSHGSISARSRSSIGTKHSQSTKGSGGFGIDYPAQVIVLDEQKKDVTPISLLSLKPSVLQQHTMFMNSTSAQDSPMVHNSL
jgi:hypothetical protein